MPEHRIRLRGAWELIIPGAMSPEVRRWTLPADWPDGLDGPVRLVRRFGPPPVDPAEEAISLELRAVPGLAGIDLNGRPLPGPPAGVDDWSVPLAGPLLPRNTLTLDVDPARARTAESWGAIALVIGPRGVGAGTELSSSVGRAGSGHQGGACSMGSDAPTVVLETGRLLLRHLSLDDLDGLATIQADPEVMRYFPSGPRSRGDVLRELERCMALQDQHGFSLWAAIHKAEGRLIGRCGLLPQAIQGRDEVEIAYLVDRAFWGQGLATEAALAIRDHGLDRLGRDRLVSIIHRDNLASRRVAEKAGLRPERMIQFMSHRCWLYSIDRGGR